MEMTRGEMQDLLTGFATRNPEYRAALLRNPKDVIQAQFQLELPANLEVEVQVETADRVYVVLPHILEEGAELSDVDLEAVAGGNSVKSDQDCIGAIASTEVEIEAGLV